jgi:hypothetical protein
MLLVLFLLLFLVGLFLVLLMPALWGTSIYQRFTGSRDVTCPESGRQVSVSFDAVHAAITGLVKRPELRLTKCTRWPERRNCGQECIPEASHKDAYVGGEIASPRSKPIPHLPVVIAAFAAWCFGAIWHSQYLFRAQWAQAAGLAGLPPRALARSLAPHLLSVGICFLFAYGVAWLLGSTGKKGIGQGIAASLLLWGAVALASLSATGVAGISGELLKIEAFYTFLASIMIGVIEGAFSSRSALPGSTG